MDEFLSGDSLRNTRSLSHEYRILTFTYHIANYYWSYSFWNKSIRSISFFFIYIMLSSKITVILAVYTASTTNTNQAEHCASEVLV